MTVKSKKDNRRQNKTTFNSENKRLITINKKNNLNGSTKFSRSSVKKSDIHVSRLSKKEKFTSKQKFFLIFSGAIIGFLNGFFGGGGGMVCVPILQKVLNLDAKHSHATAIMIIFPLSLISAFIYVFNGYIQSFPLLTIGLGVIAGGIVGAFALKFLPPKVIRLIFAVIMFVGGIKLIL